MKTDYELVREVAERQIDPRTFNVSTRQAALARLVLAFMDEVGHQHTCPLWQVQRSKAAVCNCDFAYMHKAIAECAKEIRKKS